MRSHVYTDKHRTVLQLLRSLHSQDDNIYNTVIETLSKDGQAIEPILLDLLQDPNVQIRCDASKAIRVINSDQAVNFLLTLLYDNDSTVRWHTCGLLYDIGDSRAVESLMQLLKSEPDGDVRYVAALALGKIGDKRALPTLQWTVDHDEGVNLQDDPVRLAAQEAIDRIGANPST